MKNKRLQKYTGSANFTCLQNQYNLCNIENINCNNLKAVLNLQYIL